jgi:hypothetical protein
MNDDNNTLSFSVDQNDGLMIAPGGVAAATAQMEGVMPSLAADRLYQFAALTAGIFLLATML